MTQTLYLIRHGQTLFNRRGLIQGRCDSPLTALGRAQARAAGAWLRERGVRPQAAFSSTSERACDTLELACPGVPYERLKGLRELYFGLLEGVSGEVIPHPVGNFAVAYGGESAADCGRRVSRTLAEALRGTDAQVVVAASHGAAIREFCFMWGGEKIGVTGTPPNCAVVEYRFDGERFEPVAMADPASGAVPEQGDGL